MLATHIPIRISPNGLLRSEDDNCFTGQVPTEDLRKGRISVPLT